MMNVGIPDLKDVSAVDKVPKSKKTIAAVPDQAKPDTFSQASFSTGSSSVSSDLAGLGCAVLDSLTCPVGAVVELGAEIIVAVIQGIGDS